MNTEWPREESNLRPPTFRPRTQIGRDTHRDDPVCLSRFCLIVAFVISAHLGRSESPHRGPALRWRRSPRVDSACYLGVIRKTLWGWRSSPLWWRRLLVSDHPAAASVGVAEGGPAHPASSDGPCIYLAGSPSWRLTTAATWNPITLQDLYSRLTDFIDSLSTYPPKEHPAIQVGHIFNALLDATKQQYPDTRSSRRSPPRSTWACRPSPTSMRARSSQRRSSFAVRPSRTARRSSPEPGRVRGRVPDALSSAATSLIPSRSAVASGCAARRQSRSCSSSSSQSISAA